KPPVIRIACPIVMRRSRPGSGRFLVRGRPATRLERFLDLAPARSHLLHSRVLDVPKAPDLLWQAGELGRQREIVGAESAYEAQNRCPVRLDELAFHAALFAPAEHVQRGPAQELQAGQSLECVPHPRTICGFDRLATCVPPGPEWRRQVE